MYYFVVFSAVTVDTQPIDNIKLILNISNKVPKRFSIIVLCTVPIRIREKEEMVLVNLYFSGERWQSFAVHSLIASCHSKFMHYFLIYIGQLFNEALCSKSKIYRCWLQKIVFLSQMKWDLLNNSCIGFQNFRFNNSLIQSTKHKF